MSDVMSCRLAFLCGESALNLIVQGFFIPKKMHANNLRRIFQIQTTAVILPRRRKTK